MTKREELISVAAQMLAAQLPSYYKSLGGAKSSAEALELHADEVRAAVLRAQSLLAEVDKVHPRDAEPAPKRGTPLTIMSCGCRFDGNLRIAVCDSHQAKEPRTTP